MATEKTRKAATPPARKTAARAAQPKRAPSKATKDGQAPAAPVKEVPPPRPSPAGAEVPLVGLDEVAKMLRISPLQVRQMVQSGRIPGVKVEGEWRFNKDLVFDAFHRRSRGF